MTHQPRDRWEKMDVLAKVVGALLIPPVLLIIGHWHARELSQSEYENRSQLREIEHARADQLTEIEDARRALDRAAIILRHLASDSARERELAMHFVEYLDNSGQFPDELYPILITALADEDEAVRGPAERLLPDIVLRFPQIADDPRLVFDADIDAGIRDRGADELRPEVWLRPDYEALIERRRPDR